VLLSLLLGRLVVCYLLLDIFEMINPGLLDWILIRLEIQLVTLLLAMPSSALTMESSGNLQRRHVRTRDLSTA